VLETETDNYLELYDKVSSWVYSTCDSKKQGWFISGECINGHRYAKELVCGKEFCQVCGADGSVAHMRRFARWMVKIKEFKTMGYFVFTIPESIRYRYRTKKALRKLGHDIQSMLKEFGYKRGLRRWHWFGDKTSKYHPHLNCLVDGAYINGNKLKRIKKRYAQILNVNVADVNYHYRRTPGRMIHTLRYITRATFRDYKWDIELVNELRVFRNMVVWGKNEWKGIIEWGKDYKENDIDNMNIIEKLEIHVCPDCGEKIEWGTALPRALLNIVEKTEIGAGYWKLKDDIRGSPVC